MPRLCSLQRKLQRSCNERSRRLTDEAITDVEPTPRGHLVHSIEARTLDLIFPT